METTCIINSVCDIFQMSINDLICKKSDRSEYYKGVEGNKKYLTAMRMTVLLMREKVLVKKTTNKFGSELKTITYKEIAEVFKRKAHWTIMDLELQAKENLKKNKEFKEKYELIINKCQQNSIVSL